MGLIDDVPGGIDVETGRIFIAGAGMGCLRLGIGRILPGVIAARRDWREVVDMVLVGWGARWLVRPSRPSLVGGSYQIIFPLVIFPLIVCNIIL